MERYNYTPINENLGAMLRIFGYLNHHMKHRIICDIRLLGYQVEVDIYLNWSELYTDSVEEIPPNMPDTKNNTVIITTFVDAYHSHDIETRQYVNGLLIFLNKTPIHWYSRW